MMESNRSDPLVTLSLTAEASTEEQIKRSLAGLTRPPTTSWRAGERRFPNARRPNRLTYTTYGWQLRLGPRRVLDPTEILSELLTYITDSHVLESEQRAIKFTVTIHLEMASEAPGCHLEPELLTALAALGASLDIDIYVVDSDHLGAGPPEVS